MWRIFHDGQKKDLVHWKSQNLSQNQLSNMAGDRLFLFLFVISCSLADNKTAMMGPNEAHERMPKPSATWLVLAIDPPSANTIGTVTGPVVTPALSHATQVIASSDTAVKAPM